MCRLLTKPWAVLDAESGNDGPTRGRVVVLPVKIQEDGTFLQETVNLLSILFDIGGFWLTSKTLPVIQ